MFLRFSVKFFFSKHGQDLHLLHDLTHVLDGMHHVAGTGFALGADHGRALRNPTQRLAQVPRAAHEWNFESVLVHVMSFVSRSQHFRLIDVVHAQFLKYLGFSKMSDTALRHYGNGNRRHDFANLFGRGHARHTTLSANLRRNALQRHDRNGASFLGNHGLLGIGDVHDHAALEHFRQSSLQAQAVGVPVVMRGGVLRHEFRSSFRIVLRLILYWTCPKVHLRYSSHTTSLCPRRLPLCPSVSPLLRVGCRYTDGCTMSCVPQYWKGGSRPEHAFRQPVT